MPARVRILKAALLGSLALVLVGGLVGAGWVWRHPHAFSGSGGGSEFMSLARVGRTTYFGMEGPDSARVTLRSVEPDVAVDTAAATFQVWVRTPRRAAGVGVVNEQMVKRFCDLAPVTGAVLEPSGSTRRNLVLGITPHRPGVVEVHGLEIRYDSGWQSGSQHADLDAGLRAH